MDSQTSVIDALPGLVWTARPDGGVDFVNQAWRDYTGTDLDQAMGDGWWSAVHTEDLPSLLEAWHGIRASGRPTPFEARLRRFDGQWHRFAWRIRARRNAGGALMGWVGMLVDVADIVSTASPNGDIDFRPLFDSIPGSVSVMTAAGTVEYVNLPGRTYRGATIDQLRPWRTSGSIHHEDVPGAAAMWAHCLSTGEPFDREHRIRGADGTYRWFRVRGTAARNADGEVIRWCFLDEDIDDMRASAARLRTIIDAGPGFVWSAGPDGSVEFLNQRWYDYTGMGPDDARGYGWTTAIHPDDAEGLARYWTHLLQSVQPGQYEARLRRFDGMYRWFLIKAVPQLGDAGRVVRWYGANTDIDDRKQAELLLAGEKQVLRMMAGGSSLPDVLGSLCSLVESTLDGGTCSIVLVDPRRVRLSPGAEPLVHLQPGVAP